MDRWIDRWFEWARCNFDAGQHHHGWLAWGAAVVVPAAFVLSVHLGAQAVAGWPLALLWHVAVLYTTLGFRRFSHRFAEVREALEADDLARARQVLAQWRGEPSPEDTTELIRALIRQALIDGHRHMFGVLFWYVVVAALGGGPAGAVFYRLSDRLRDGLKRRGGEVVVESASLMRVAGQAWIWLDAVPSRVTALWFAMVGSFEDAIEVWRGLSEDWGRARATGSSLRRVPARSTWISVRRKRKRVRSKARRRGRASSPVAGPCRRSGIYRRSWVCSGDRSSFGFWCWRSWRSGGCLDETGRPARSGDRSLVARCPLKTARLLPIGWTPAAGVLARLAALRKQGLVDPVALRGNSFWPGGADGCDDGAIGFVEVGAVVKPAVADMEPQVGHEACERQRFDVLQPEFLEAG